MLWGGHWVDKLHCNRYQIYLQRAAPSLDCQLPSMLMHICGEEKWHETKLLTNVLHVNQWVMKSDKRLKHNDRIADSLHFLSWCVYKYECSSPVYNMHITEKDCKTFSSSRRVCLIIFCAPSTVHKHTQIPQILSSDVYWYESSSPVYNMYITEKIASHSQDIEEFVFLSVYLANTVYKPTHSRPQRQFSWMQG